MAAKKDAYTAAESGEKAVVTTAVLETDSTPSRGFPKGSTRVLIVANDPETFREGKVDDKTVYYGMASRIYAHIAKHLGMEESDPKKLSYEVDVTIDGKTTKQTVYIKGARGGKSIKVPVMRGTQFAESTKGHRRMFSIPIPGNANLKMINAFLAETIKDNKPPYFVSKDGIQHPIFYT